MDVFLTFSVYVLRVSPSVIFITKLVNFLTPPLLDQGEPHNSHLNTAQARTTSDRCYHWIFFIPYSNWENPLIKASASLLQFFLPSPLLCEYQTVQRIPKGFRHRQKDGNRGSPPGEPSTYCLNPVAIIIYSNRP